MDYLNSSWLSEEGNDRWVAEIFNFKRDGYFIEAGSTMDNGNSTLLLEKKYNWDGIAINAHKEHCDEICRLQNRKNIENSALWKKDGTAEFHYAGLRNTSEAKQDFSGRNINLSYVCALVEPGPVKRYKDLLLEQGEVITVPTISPSTLLKKYNSPKTIDYLAMDIENSEYHVLKVFPFDEYEVLTMSVENSSSFQEFIEECGFTRVINPYCPKPFEHHYINNKLLKEYPFGFWNKNMKE